MERFEDLLTRLPKLQRVRAKGTRNGFHFKPNTGSKGRVMIFGTTNSPPSLCSVKETKNPSKAFFKLFEGSSSFLSFYSIKKPGASHQILWRCSAVVRGELLLVLLSCMESDHAARHRPMCGELWQADALHGSGLMNPAAGGSRA
jgi:hypothetical protein